MASYLPDARGSGDLLVGAVSDSRTGTDKVMQWLGNLSLTHAGYEVPTLESFALDGRYLYWEQGILIEALEHWLESWRFDENA